MITTLTCGQQAQIEVYRKRYFELATSTVTDYDKAESSVIQLGLPGRTIIWVNSLEEAPKIRDSEGNTELLDSLRNSLQCSLRHLLRDSLWYSLWYSLQISLQISLRNSLQYSLLDSLQDAGWICYYTYCRDVLGVKYDQESNRKLDLHNRLLESCFGTWAVPGKSILLRKPTQVEIKEGTVLDCAWLQEPACRRCV